MHASVFAYTSSGSSRRSSSLNSSDVVRRFNATGRSGCPGTLNVATAPSGRVNAIGPDGVNSRTAVIPGPREFRCSTGTFNRDCNHADIRSALGFPRAAVTSAPVTFVGY